MARRTQTSKLLEMDVADFNRLTKAELKQAVRTLSYSANRRLREFANAGEESPATRYAEESGGFFTGRGKDTVNELRTEFMRAKGYLTAKTSTLEGWTETRSQTVESLQESGVQNIEDLTDEQYDLMWKAYERLKENNPEIASKQFKYNVLNEIASMVTDRRRTPASIARAMASRLDELYEREESLNGGTGVSRFIKLE